MKLEDYKAGEYKQELDALLAEANRQIGELNAYSLLLPNWVGGTMPSTAAYVSPLVEDTVELVDY